MLCVPETTYAPLSYAEFQIAFTPAQKPFGSVASVGASVGSVGSGVSVVTMCSFSPFEYINLSLLLPLANGLFSSFGLPSLEAI